MTKENTKFKDALQEFNSAMAYNPENMSHERKETIRLALRLADRLTMEPSKGMIGSGQWCKQADGSPLGMEAATAVFKAMTDQLFKELDEVV